jgi:hypothetical protein
MNTDKGNNLLMYIGVGILCYGIMLSMCIYCITSLIVSYKSLPAISLYVMTLICALIVIHSILKVIRILRKPKDELK